MSHAEVFKRMFPNVALGVEDLFLLEAFQIGYLPGWAPERELAIVLHAHPALRRYLAARCPSVAEYVERVAAQFPPDDDPATLAAAGERLVWMLADLLIYNKAPEAYAAQAFHKWDFGEITAVTPLTDKLVIDGGAGTGRVALEAAHTARQVFAVEPVGRLRQFMRAAAAQRGQRNVYVIDGFLDAIPLPDGFADVLITSHALGWRLEAELQEFERVVKPGGFIIHCPGTSRSEEAQHQRLIALEWGYAFAWYNAPDGRKRKYWKRRR